MGQGSFTLAGFTGRESQPDCSTRGAASQQGYSGYPVMPKDISHRRCPRSAVRQLILIYRELIVRGLVVITSFTF